MEEIVSRSNMMKALNRVVSNKGAAGIDGMATSHLKEYLQREWPRIKEELLMGRYQPQPVRKVEIPKPGGGMRMLGIPTVLDRLIQQAPAFLQAVTDFVPDGAPITRSELHAVT